MGNQPAMPLEHQINSKCTMWHVLVQQGKDERAAQLLDEIHALQWQHGRNGGYDWLKHD